MIQYPSFAARNEAGNPGETGAFGATLLAGNYAPSTYAF